MPLSPESGGVTRDILVPRPSGERKVRPIRLSCRIVGGVRGMRLKILNPPNGVILVPAFAGINSSGNPEVSTVSP